MRATHIPYAMSLVSLVWVVGCGPGRLSDSDLTRLCELQVMCSGGSFTQASCEAALDAQREAANTAGCGGQFGAAGRCVLREESCGPTPAACEDEEERLESCLSRRDSGTPPSVDAGFVLLDSPLPDTGGSCPITSEEYGLTYCSDRCDNDEDGVFDCNDSSCCGTVDCPPGTVCGSSCVMTSESTYGYCTDGCDNDSDGTSDCDDSGCCDALDGSCPVGTLCSTAGCTFTEETSYTYCTDGCDNDEDGRADCDESACCAALSGECPSDTLCGSATMGEDIRTTLGYLEVYYMAEWRPVCDDAFDSSDANVACRQLGFTGAETFMQSVSCAGVTSFWLDDLACTGTELSLGACAHSGWGTHNCGSTECVSVICF